MSTAIRVRVIALQAILVLVLGFAAGFAFYESSFVTNMIHDELVSQKITFPPASEIKSGGALDPAEFPQEIQQYAGQPLDKGDKARVYANDFIGIHLAKVAGGKTYAEVSALAAADPKNTTLAAQKTTLFQGETLRGMLLNAYGWSEVALFTWYAAVGLSIAALAVLATLVFEVVLAVRNVRAIAPVPTGKTAGAAG